MAFWALEPPRTRRPKSSTGSTARSTPFLPIRGSRAQLAGFGSTVFAGTPAEFGRYVREDVDKWAKVVKFAGVGQ